MKEFAHEHPWLTFFLGMAAINGAVTLIRGYDPVLKLASTAVKPTTSPGAATSAVMGLFGTDFHTRSDAGRAVDGLVHGARRGAQSLFGSSAAW